MFHQKRPSSLKIIFFIVLVDLVGFGMIIPLIPFLGRHFEADPFQISFLLTCFSGAQFIFAPFWGKTQ